MTSLHVNSFSTTVHPLLMVVAGCDAHGGATADVEVINVSRNITYIDIMARSFSLVPEYMEPGKKN